MDNVGRPVQPYSGLAIPSKQTLFSWLLGKKQGRLQEEGYGKDGRLDYRKEGMLQQGKKARLQEGRKYG